MYVVVNLASTDDAFLTSICFRKPHLEHICNHSYLQHMQEGMSLPFVFPKTVSCVSRSSMHLQSVFLEMIVCENIDRFLFPAYVNIFTYIVVIYIYIYLCFFRPRFYGRCFFDQHLLEETTLRT